MIDSTNANLDSWEKGTKVKYKGGMNSRNLIPNKIYTVKEDFIEESYPYGQKHTMILNELPEHTYHTKYFKRIYEEPKKETNNNNLILDKVKRQLDNKIETTLKIIDMVKYKGFSLACLYEELGAYQNIKDMINQIENGYDEAIGGNIDEMDKK